ncbi:hypothetical protein BU23DRAFT_276433 [Bimuria novae-zelandiae CBS 107.79]|uniref:Uncharacterized protein n=1 Tax=Bimuria novae-zelandiae CBS 107.79 TaxID=1447943 RepID=A0A6A5VMX9_9PLEO|nr:hypothetical protein BU23DRAFT_276433 [Bimuria novae-zelandiae CBS 107.79]
MRRPWSRLEQNPTPHVVVPTQKSRVEASALLTLGLIRARQNQGSVASQVLAIEGPLSGLSTLTVIIDAVYRRHASHLCRLQFNNHSHLLNCGSSAAVASCVSASAVPAWKQSQAIHSCCQRLRSTGALSYIVHEDVSTICNQPLANRAASQSDVLRLDTCPALYIREPTV